MKRKKRQQPSEERYIEPLHGCKLDGVHFFHEDCFTGGSYRFPCFFFTTLAVLSATKNFHLNGNWMWTKKQTKQKICTCQTKIPQCESVFFSLSLSHFHVARFRMSVTFLMELFEISLKFEFKMFVEAEWVYVPKCWMYWSGSLKHLFEQQQPQQQHKCWHANQREKNHTL